MSYYLDFLKILKRKISYFLWILLDPFKFKIIHKNKIKKILIINLGFIGDLLATTPVISSIKNKLNVQIDFLVRPGLNNVFTKNKEISKILEYQNSFSKNLSMIKKENYDLALIVWPGSIKVSLLCLFSKIKYRIGSTQSGLFEGSGYFLTKKVNPPSKQVHKVYENLLISSLINIKEPRRITFPFDKSDISFTNKLLKENNVKKPIFILHPGKRGRFFSEYSWKSENFAQVADYLSKEYNSTVILTGGKEDKKICQSILEKTKNKNIISFAGKINLTQFAALLSKSKLIISIDTASVHIASSKEVDKPLIVINTKYPKVWHPFMSKKKYIMLKNPLVEKVKHSIKKIIKNGKKA